jgi:hypothetical protein
MIDRIHVLSIARQAKILNVSRGAVYYESRPGSAADSTIMRRLDELHLDSLFAGSRMLRDMLRREGVSIGRRDVATLMKYMGIEAIYRRPNTSEPAPGHRVHPFLASSLDTRVWPPSPLLSRHDDNCRNSLGRDRGLRQRPAPRQFLQDKFAVGHRSPRTDRSYAAVTRDHARLADVAELLRQFQQIGPIVSNRSRFVLPGRPKRSATGHHSIRRDELKAFASWLAQTFYAAE